MDFNIGDKISAAEAPVKSILYSLSHIEIGYPFPSIDKEEIFLKCKYKLGYTLVIRLNDGYYFNLIGNHSAKLFTYLGQLPDISKG